MRVTFEPGIDPELYDTGGARAACLLYKPDCCRRLAERPTAPRHACPRMRVTLMLADAAQVSEGKLHLLGGGWSITGPPAPRRSRSSSRSPGTRPTASWNGGSSSSTPTGIPVLTPDGEGGENPIMMGGEFEVGRPPGTPHGAPIGLPLALNLAPLPLAPASRYEWRFTLDGESREDWRLAFSTR